MGFGVTEIGQTNKQLYELPVKVIRKEGKLGTPNFLYRIKKGGSCFGDSGEHVCKHFKNVTNLYFLF